MRKRWFLALGLLAAALAARQPQVAADSAVVGPYNGHFYKLFTTTTNWHQAETNAQNLGGYLACLTTDGENTWVYQQLVQGQGITPWIGLNDEQTENTWVWSSGETFSYSAWAGGEPNNSGNEDMVTYRTDGQWNDLAGTSSQTYIVEWESDPNGPPEIPTNLKVVAATDTQVDLQWTDPSLRENGFDIARSEDGVDFTKLGSVGPNATTYSDRTVTGQTTYWYVVRSFGSGGTSEDSNVVSVTTPPLTVGDLTATVISNSSIRLDWADRSAIETDVKIERGVGNPVNTWAQVKTLPADSVTYLDAGLTPETTYGYRVRVGSPGGNSSYTPTVYAMTPPADPSGISVAALSDTSVVVGWGDTSTAETRFEVFRADGNPGVDYVQVGTVLQNVTAFTDTTASPESTYSYRVRAGNDVGTSEWSPFASVTTPTFAPSEAVAEPLSPTRVRFTWKDNSSKETGFRVVRALASDQRFQTLANLPADTTEYVDATATQEGEYVYRVAALDKNGISGWATVNDATLPALVAVKTAKIARPRKGDAKLTVIGEFDVGDHAPDYTGAGVLTIAGESIDLAGLSPKGRGYTYKGDGIQATFTPAGKTSSRVRFVVKRQGPAVTALDPDAEIGFAYSAGAYSAAAVVQLAGNTFKPPKKGSLVDPNFSLKSLRATLKFGAGDSLVLKGPFHADAMPDQAPDVLVRLRFFELEFKSAQFQRSGTRWIFQQKELGSRTVILDYAKGLVSVSLRGLELGDYPKGTEPVRVSVDFGDVHFDDMPLMTSTGKALKY